MIEQELKDLIIKRYGSINKFSENIDIAWTTLDGVLKRGVNKANITSLIKICNGLNIDCESLYYGRILPKQEFLTNNPLNENELDHIKKYRNLDSYGRKQVDCVLNNEYERVQDQSLEIAEESIPYIYTKTEYLTGLSAGTGLFVFDDIPTQTTEVPEKYKNADFVIGVTGDSMDPTFSNGDRVAVKKQSIINTGEIGVFMINGNGYIKELGNNELISHNKNYENINLDENSICIGKVLGKI